MLNLQLWGIRNRKWKRRRVGSRTHKYIYSIRRVGAVFTIAFVETSNFSLVPHNWRSLLHEIYLRACNSSGSRNVVWLYHVHRPNSICTSEGLLFSSSSPPAYLFYALAKGVKESHAWKMSQWILRYYIHSLLTTSTSYYPSYPLCTKYICSQTKAYNSSLIEPI